MKKQTKNKRMFWIFILFLCVATRYICSFAIAQVVRISEINRQVSRKKKQTETSKQSIEWQQNKYSHKSIEE